MKIVICASISSTPLIKEISEKLNEMGHITFLPYTSQKIINGEMKMEKYLKEKAANGDAKFRDGAAEDLIIRFYNFIKNSDAILVINIDKNGIKNYIGGNVLMEIGFAYVLGKKIFYLNAIPRMRYTDELKAVSPIVINGDLNKII